MTLVAPPQKGGAIATRSFIPHRVHEAIGVLAAVSVATACVTPGTVAADVAGLDAAPGARRLNVEHPTGFFTVEMDVEQADGGLKINRSALLRTARKLMRGEVYVPAGAWGADMTRGARICLIGFGEVGQILADDLRRPGHGAVGLGHQVPGPDSIPARGLLNRRVRTGDDAAEAVAGRTW